jgi:peptidoglycan/LPS O-acetylase OafA/YrhL
MIGPVSSLRGMTSTGAPGAGRLIGLDLAHGLAVFGMSAVHVGPAPDQGEVIGFLMELAQGRSSALFAVLAGFAVALITRRRTPKTGTAGRARCRTTMAASPTVPLIPS